MVLAYVYCFEVVSEVLYSGPRQSAVDRWKWIDMLPWFVCT